MVTPSTSFILTVVSYTVAIYCLPHDQGKYKVFDSHSKDLLGMTHPYGTCTLIEVDSLNDLVEYFNSFHASTTGIMYELKGVSVCQMEIDNEHCNQNHAQKN